jgi:hypothetical protein
MRIGTGRALFACTTAASAREIAPAKDVTRTAERFQQIAVPSDLLLVRYGPTNDDIAKAVLKALGALILYDQSMDPKNDELTQVLARAARDKLIDSAVQDLLPNSPMAERAAVRNLVILAFDGKLPRDRDRVIAELRRTNPDAADAVEIAEFLIRLSQAAEKARR